MKIISCIKQVYDLDKVLENDWVIDETSKNIDISYANLIMNPYDETALELMLRMTDSSKELISEVVTIGNQKSEAILRKALAIGVNYATRINVKEQDTTTPFNIASLLHHQITSDNDIQLVLCGRQSDILNHGQTGQILAQKLGWSCFTNVFNIKYENNYFHISRLLNDGIEHIKTKEKAVITITQSPNMFLRMATLMNTMKAKQKPIKLIDLNETAKVKKNSLEEYKLDKLTIEKSKKECVFLTNDKEISLQLNELINNYLNKEAI